jgi:hypothetical protein
MRYSIGGSKWVKVERDFRSSLLLVRWVRSYTTRVYPPTLAGTLEIAIESPWGKREPSYRSILCTRNQKNYEWLPIALGADEFFKIRVKNPLSLERSAIDITELYPDNLPTNMPWPSNNPPAGTDPALLAAINAQTAELTAIKQNTAPDAVADAIANNAMLTIQPTQIAVGTTAVSVIPADNTRQTLSFTHLAGGQIKLWPSPTPPAAGTTFANVTALAMLSSGNAAGEANAEDSKSQWWAICSNANGSIAYTGSKTAP